MFVLNSEKSRQKRKYSVDMLDEIVFQIKWK